MFNMAARQREAADALAQAREAARASDAAHHRLLGHREWLTRAQAALPPRVKAARAAIRDGDRA
jgi:hypothetical protein